MNESILTPPPRSIGCPPNGALEILAAGDGQPQVAEHVLGCNSCKHYVESLRREHSAFVRRQSGEQFLRRLDARRPSATRLSFKWPAFTFAGLSAAAALALFLVHPGQVIHWKGGHMLVVYKRAGMSQPKEVVSDLRLRKGDALRFSYAAPKDGHLFILEVDGNRNVTALYPLHGSRSEPIRAGPSHVLPGSAVLDDAPGPEWLIAVFSERSLELSSLAQPLRSIPPTAEPTLNCQCEVEAIRIQKEP